MRVSLPTGLSKVICNYLFPITLITFSFSGCFYRVGGDPSANPNAAASTTPTSSSSGQVTKTGLTGNYQSTYFVSAKVGNTPGFNFILDTGSSDLAIGSTLCKNCSGTFPLYNVSSGAQFYNGTAGSTKKTPVTLSDSYGDNTGWNATEYIDSITLTGVNSIKMTFAAISNLLYYGGNYVAGGSILDPNSSSTPQGTIQERSFFAPGTEGLMGMAGSMKHGDPNMSGYMDLLQSAGYSPILTFEMCRSNGNLWVGGFDPTFMTTPPTYTPIQDKNDFFTVHLTDIQLDGTSLGFSDSDFNNLSTNADPVYPIVDTGTSMFVIPTTVYQAIATRLKTNPAFISLIANNQSLNGADFFDNYGTGDNTSNICITGPSISAVDSQLPRLILIFDSTTPGQSITVTLPASKSYLTFEPITNTAGGTICSGIIDGGSGAGTIMGVTALQSQIVIFDRANGQIGFAPDKGCPTTN